MAGLYSLSREAVRVKVKKSEGNLAPEWRKFSVDPQITSLEVLYSILAKAFDIKTDFSLSYKAIDPNGQDVYLAVLSDWDLDAAFLRAHNFSISMNTDPCLNLKVDVKPFSEATDWESSNTTTKETSSLQQSLGVGQKYVQNMQNRLPGLMEKTFSMVTRALNFVEDQNILQPLRLPLSDAEFLSFCDSVGQVVQPNILRKVIYSGGIDPSLRRVVWKHILNVYPDGMTGRQRMDYMKQKSAEYYKLRDVWREAIQHQEPVTGELAYVTNMVKKDVLRTDRLHSFYAGNDENQNIGSLFNILTTYALNHPAVSYCQGMSDIASPLLVTMCDEAQAYICFCAIMKRLSTNFMLDGIAMTQKFTHLSEALQFYDPEFYEYLKLQQADDLLFCYRWLLLEMKREFAFEDSLRMLEVLWSSLDPEPPVDELKLFEKEFIPSTKEDSKLSKTITCGVTMRKPRENAYTKLCELRRQSSSQSSLPTSPNTINSTDSIVSKALDGSKRLNQSLDECKDRDNVNTSRSISKNYQSLDEIKLRNMKQKNHMIHSVEQDEESTFSEGKNNGMDKQENLYNNNDGIDKSSSHKLLYDQIIQKNDNSVEKNTGGHFKELKERIAANKKEMFDSFDKIEQYPIDDVTNVSLDDKSDDSLKSGKVVKNFNEFLSFASKGAKLTLNRSNSVNDARVKNTRLRTTKSSHQSFDQEKTFDTDICTQNDNRSKQSLLKLQESIQSNDGSSPEDSQEYFPMTTSITRELRLELDNLNRQVFGNNFVSKSKSQTNHFEYNSPESADSQRSNNRSSAKFLSEISYTKFNQHSEDEAQLDKICSSQDTGYNNIRLNEPNSIDLKRSSVNAEVFIWENPLHQLSPIAPLLPPPPPTTKTTTLSVESKNPFLAKDFLQTLTPDEQNELEYDGDIIDERCSGKKSVTPIRLLNSNHSSKRNSNIFRNDSDTDSSAETNENVVKLKTFSETNPFLMDIVSSFDEPTNSIQATFIDEEASEAQTNAVLQKSIKSLPAPHEFGGGNPFLMFLCLTLLLQHRNYVMKNNMDYNEMAMHFDKMVRKHNVVRVLNQARRMYSEYLKSQNMQTTNARKSSNRDDVDATNENSNSMSANTRKKLST